MFWPMADRALALVTAEVDLGAAQLGRELDPRVLAALLRALPLGALVLAVVGDLRAIFVPPPRMSAHGQPAFCAGWTPPRIVVISLKTCSAGPCSMAKCHQWYGRAPPLDLGRVVERGGSSPIR
jgi:hypothetical protein